MTLIVSVRTPDGVVIASDSLLPLVGQGSLEAPVDVTSPEGNHKQKIQQPSVFPLPQKTFSYAQKIFPFCGKFGIGVFGAAGLLENKSIYSIIRLFEQELKETSPIRVTDIAEKIGNEIHGLLKEQFKRENTSVDTIPEDQAVLGFQVIGYDGTDPKTVEVHLGKAVHRRVQRVFGSTISGSQEVVQAIWGLYKTQPENQPPYPLFSLQDAIDYAEFLIRTTIDHQRFSRTMPSVGGDIDIALVTLFDGFQWIRQKPLGEVLEGK